MAGRINVVLMCVKFGDNPISTLDFGIIGGCTIKPIANRLLTLEFSLYLCVYTFLRNLYKYFVILKVE